ncbi:MAG: DUF599 domain-containing protein [Burkholderiaceae bacterium]
MTDNMIWLAVLATIAILFVNEAVLLLAQRRNPGALARTAHASLREEWFIAVSKQQGSEILAVQTIRNSLMSATMTASTAALGLVGTVTLATPSLHATFGAMDTALHFTPRLLSELVLIALLFASLVCSAMAVRYYNHAGYIVSMPVNSEERDRWSDTGTIYLRRAGMLYSWGLRHLVLVAPILAAILHPAAGPIVAVLVIVILSGFDRFSKQ